MPREDERSDYKYFRTRQTFLFIQIPLSSKCFSTVRVGLKFFSHLVLEDAATEVLAPLFKLNVTKK